MEPSSSDQEFEHACEALVAKAGKLKMSVLTRPADRVFEVVAIQALNLYPKRILIKWVHANL